ncbi:MAG: cytochrome c biogenesis protein CcdA [Micrococcales bacterium]|nr:cytochrome c biogenesis protein CcdA [Micrococcales bacterium]
MTEVNLLAAVAAGTLALLSPCSALLLPSFFAYAFSSRTALLARTGVFYAGLLITLVPLGSGAALVSSVFYGHRQLLVAVAGWLIIAMGVAQILGWGFTLPGVSRLQSWSQRRQGQGRGYGSTLALGAVYGLAGFCSGPVLGAILTIAATQDTPVLGGLLLAVYAFGMALPLFVLAALWDRFDLGRRGWLRGRAFTVGRLHLHTTSVVSGVLFVVIGALFLRFDGTAGVSAWFGVGDTSDLEVSAQNAVARAVPPIPFWVLPLVVAVVALTVAAVRHRRSSGDRRQREPSR